MGIIALLDTLIKKCEYPLFIKMFKINSFINIFIKLCLAHLTMSINDSIVCIGTIPRIEEEILLSKNLLIALFGINFVMLRSILREDVHIMKVATSAMDGKN